MFLKLRCILFFVFLPLGHMYEPALFVRNPLLSRCFFEIYFRNVLERRRSALALHFKAPFEMGLLALSQVQSVCLSPGYSCNDANNSSINVISCSCGQIPENPEFNSETSTDPVGK